MKTHNLKHHIHVHNIILFAVLIGAVAFWGFGVAIYGKAKTNLREVKEIYTTLDQKLSETTRALDDVKAYCVTQTIIAPLPELPNGVE